MHSGTLVPQLEGLHTATETPLAATKAQHSQKISPFINLKAPTGTLAGSDLSYTVSKPHI